MNDQVSSMTTGVPIWYNVVNYYNELKSLWETIRKARLNFNDASLQSAQLGAKCLEDWFVAQQMILDYIANDAEKEAKTAYAEIVALHDEIRAITFNRQFSQCDVGETEWLQVKMKLEKADRLRCIIESKLGLYMHKKRAVELDNYLV